MIVSACSDTWSRQRITWRPEGATALGSRRIRHGRVARRLAAHAAARAFSATQAGRALSHARAILQQAERLREDLGASAGAPAGQSGLSRIRILAEFSSAERIPGRASQVSVEFERLSDEIGQIAEGVADIGIVAGTVDTGALTTFPFRKDRFVLAVARGHALAKRSEIAFADVLEQNFVGLDRSSAIQRFLSDKAARIGKPLRLRIQLRSFDAVCRMVESNVGIGIVPETTARRAAKTMAIATVALKDAWALRELTICVRDRGTAELCAAAGGLSARTPVICRWVSGSARGD